MTNLKRGETPDLRTFSDIHTHGRTGASTVTSVEPKEGFGGNVGEAWYSVGIHPWSTAQPVPEADIEAVRRLAADPRVVAVGECGFDRNRGGSADYQREIFLRHVEISETAGKPLVIHCVGRYGLLLDLHRTLKPRQLWVVHGFTGKPELARQLASEGIAVSLGRRSNPEIEKILPPEMIYHETDDLG